MQLNAGAGRPDHKVSRLSHPKAEVHIIENERKRLCIEPAQILKHLSAHHQTIAAHCAPVLSNLQTLEVSTSIGGVPLERAVRRPGHPNDQTSTQDLALRT
ncbi:hypothetical protein D3C81_1465760 [compost metagenome]